MDENLQKDITKLIGKIRQEAAYSRIYESCAVADALEDTANAFERLLGQYSISITVKPGVQGGWRTTSYRMFGVYPTCSW